MESTNFILIFFMVQGKWQLGITHLKNKEKEEDCNNNS